MTCDLPYWVEKAGRSWTSFAVWPLSPYYSTLALQKHLYLYSQGKRSWEWGAKKSFWNQAQKVLQIPICLGLCPGVHSEAMALGTPSRGACPYGIFQLALSACLGAFLWWRWWWWLLQSLLCLWLHHPAHCTLECEPWLRWRFFPYFLWNLKCKPLSW